MKHRITITGFDLNVIGNRVRVSMPGVASVVASAWKVTGLWANNLTVQRHTPAADFAFASAKVITPTVPCALASADLEGAAALTIAAAAQEVGVLDIAIEVESEGVPVITQGAGVVERVA